MKKSILITGPAGSGKTAHCLRVCLEALRRTGPDTVIYLVPGAETVRHVERELLVRGGCRGVLGELVMDFAELALRILKEGGCLPIRYVSPLERKYLLFRTIRESPLRFFENVRNYDGFAEVVADFIAELKRGMISPEDFIQGCRGGGGRGGIAGDKVDELHAIYRAYHAALTERDAYDGDGVRWKAAEVLAANASLFSGVEVLLVDGFATYTPVEFEMLAHLVRRVKESHITLCYEQGRPRVFDFVEVTYARLKKLCTAEEIVLNRNRRSCGELLHLEKSVFGEGENRIPAGTSISILPCPDAHAEVEAVAREIEAIRREEGLDYRDFTVIFRELGEYLRSVTEVFGERGIPFSLPMSGYAAEEPFIRAVVSALLLAKGDFRRENVLSVLKSSCADADMDVAAAIENYADEFGLWGEEEFRETWTQKSEITEDVSCLDDHKRRFLERLDRLRSEAKRVSSPEGFRELIFFVVRELGFLRRGERSSAGSCQAPAFSSEYRSLAAVAPLLNAMCDYSRVMGAGQADYGALLDMLERGLAWTSVPSPPTSSNSVCVTPIVGGPPAAAAVVFVCGLCERSFPKEIVSEPFFKDRERRLINRRGKIILDERLPLSAGERFFFYVAASRATRRLILSYPAADRAGKELVRSHYIEEVARQFSDLGEAPGREVPGTSVVPEFTSVSNTQELRCFVAHHLSRPVREGEEVGDESATLAAVAYNELLALGELGPSRLLYRGGRARPSADVCHPLRERDAYLTSVSELETFGRCPFRHFCKYRLRLEELPRYEFRAVEEGTLYHDVLAKLYRQIYLPSDEDGRSRDESGRPPLSGIESFCAEDLNEKLQLLVDEFISGRYARLFGTARMAVRRRALQAKMSDFLLKEVENERANATRPTYFELSFGKGKSPQNADRHSIGRPLLLGAGPGKLVEISGRIDRVDTFEEGEERFGVVVDYKRSEQASRSELRRGTVLQPGLYMMALKELFGIKPAAAFQYSIRSARKRGVFAGEEEERIAGKGDVSRTDRATYKEIRELMELNAAQAVEYVQRIMAGEIAISPADQDQCRNCPFSSICRIRDHRSDAV